jgi:hypothetical protein
MSEWKHLSSTKPKKKRSEELWVIALGFVVYFPGLVLLWRFPFDTKARKMRFRFIACTFVLPIVWAYAYLFYLLGMYLLRLLRRGLTTLSRMKG